MLIYRKYRLLLAIAAIFLVFGSSQNAFAREIVLKDLSGQPVSISDYKGKPVILFFWTTWCPFCRKELKKLNERYAAIAGDGIVVLGVNVSEQEKKVQNFFKGYQLNFPMLLDRTGALADKYDVLGVPTLVLLDENGSLVSLSHELPADYKRLLLR